MTDTTKAQGRGRRKLNREMGEGTVPRSVVSGLINAVGGPQRAFALYGSDPAVRTALASAVNRAMATGQVTIAPIALPVANGLGDTIVQAPSETAQSKPRK